MYARTGTYHVDPAHLEEALAAFQTPSARAYHGSGGARGGLLLVNRATGKLLGISFWADASAMDDSEDGAQRLREDVQRAGRGTDQIAREDWEILSLRWDGRHLD